MTEEFELKNLARILTNIEVILSRMEKMWKDFIEVNMRIHQEDEKNKEMVFRAMEKAHPGKSREEITAMLSDQSSKAMESLTEMMKKIDQQERDKNTFQPFRVERRVYPREQEDSNKSDETENKNENDHR